MNREYLEKMVNKAKPYYVKGQVATYIPELSKKGPSDLGICISSEKGEVCAGNTTEVFTIQSVSKPIVLMLAMMDRGEEKVFDFVGKEPTGDPFNSMVRLETYTLNKPLNPMINAGAISIASLINGKDNGEKINRILDFMRMLSHNEAIHVNELVYNSEKMTGDRNRSLAYFLKSIDCLEGDVEEVLDLYFMQCSIEITALDLARIGRVIANDGWDCMSKKQVVPKKFARISKSFMLTCGMYDESGQFAIDVGIPSKSGVGGGVMSSVPGKWGIGVYGPSLDGKGNSVAGMKLLEFISKDFDMSIF
jgi:glutaminase